MAKDSIFRLIAGTTLSIVGLSYAHFAQAQANEPASSTSTYNSDEATTPGQSADASPAVNQESIGEVIVTGTLIRGVAPTGTNVIEMSDEDIKASGATGTNQVLSHIPQVTSAFNSAPSIPGGTGSGINTVRPSLRDLGAGNGTTTLILIDGHRVVSTGIISTGPDPDMVPPGVLERVEVVPDGGSATYGSDAVGGVINFITRKRFDGIDVSARYGWGNDYWTTDENLTVGRDWGSGSGYVSYAFAKNDSIFGRDLSWYRQTSPNQGGCAPGTVVIGTNSYALPDRAPGAATCDNTDNASYYPEQTRNSIFASLHQELTPSLLFDVQAYYTRRDTMAHVDLNADSTQYVGQIRNGQNPYYVPIGSDDPGTQTVRFSYAGVYSGDAPNRMDTFGITPTLTADLGSGWQLRAFENIGVSIVEGHTVDVDPAAQNMALAGTTVDTALNPYDVGATDPAVLENIRRDYYGRGQQMLFNTRVVVDGALFSLPGGDVHLAAGGELIRETLSSDFGSIVPGATSTAPHTEGDRNVKAGFGELVIPIVGSGNEFAGVHSLRLSAAARYDDYSDFGDTTNPKFGLTYEPVDWISVRGNVGRSFNAPSLADMHAADSRIVVLPASPILDPNDDPSNLFRQTLVLAGGNPNLTPQKAKTWSAGLDVRPEFVPGLTVSATYYNVELTDQIAMIPALTIGGGIYTPLYADYYIKDPTIEQVQALAPGQAVQGAESLEAVYAAGTPYVLLDARRNNLAAVKQHGVDFNINYIRDTAIGVLTANFSGTYTLSRKIATVGGAKFIDELDSPGARDLMFTASVGDRIGDFTGLITWNHSGGYDLKPAVTSTRLGETQKKVDSFDVVNLFFSYDLHGSGLSKDLSLTFNIDNLFDADPPRYVVGSAGYDTGTGTLGRVASLGIRKSF